MRKYKIIKHFRRMPKTEQKEEFMKRNNIKFAYDAYNNMTLFADDGTLQLFPIDK
jgi:hypothetical protein